MPNISTKRQFMRLGKAVLAVMLLGAVLLVQAMEVSPELHRLIHKDADAPGHQCAVTMFAQGQVDSASSDVPVIASLTFVETVPVIEFSVFSPAIENLPAGRAPPVLPAVS